jgi:beta-lactamase class A
VKIVLPAASLLWLIAALQASPLHPSPAPARTARPDSTLAALQQTVVRLAAEAGGTVGLAALHVESGGRIELNAERAFPMMSVYKLPIALWILRLAEQGTVRLDRTVRVEPADLRPAYSPLAELHPREPFTISIGELLEQTVASDNTASDLLLDLAGGPAAVTAMLRAAGIEGIRLDRSEGRIAFDYHGIAVRDDAPDLSRATFDRLLPDVPPERRREAAARYLDDPRDTATPAAMLDLLVRFDRGELLTPAGTAKLRDLLERISPLDTRLKGDLPAGTRVAHKSGTSNETDGVWAAVNDVAIVTLPGRAGHVAIAVFVTGSGKEQGQIERAIARISRAVFDHWSVGSGTPAFGGSVTPDASALEREAPELVQPGRGS